MTPTDGYDGQSTGADAGALTARPGRSAARGRRRAAEAAPITRRALLRSSFWTGLGVTGAGLLLGFVNFFWPRKVVRAGSLVSVPAAEVPPPGAEPKYFRAGRFYLVNLLPGEGVPDAFASFAKPSRSGGLLALSQRCPHLGCTVPWRPDFQYEGLPRWFRCPCHQSTYTVAGVRVYGPAQRSMDTFPVRFNSDGSVQVDTTQRLPGGADNPQRTVLR